MEPLINTQQFLALSSFLNYQLSGEPVNWQGILKLVVPKKLNRKSTEYLLTALEYLGQGYGGQKRRLGPLAVLHPIRSAALLAKAQKKIEPLDLLTSMLHDKCEDITEERYSAAAWQSLEKKYAVLLEKVSELQNFQLDRRIEKLTKWQGQKYWEYLGNLLTEAIEVPSLASIKLADRLDNTLDLRVDLHDFSDHSRCFQTIFDIIYLQSYKGFKSSQPHPIPGKINGAMRLYQLYKNAVFLSLLRYLGVRLDITSSKLFNSLAIASIREAETILLHVFAYHLKDAAKQKKLLLDVMNYSHKGGFNSISTIGGHSLDGLFKSYFEFKDKKMKQKGLADLYKNKKLMGEAALGFIIIFATFINDETYTIKGIYPEGIMPQN